jgi:hypothetical protein
MIKEAHVAVFWVVMRYSNVVGYRRFGGPCCSHLQSEVFVSYHISTPCHNPEDHDLNLHRCEKLMSLIKDYQTVKIHVAKTNHLLA